MYRLSILLILVSLACSGPPRGPRVRPTHPQIPAALLVEQVITGTILGQELQNPVGLAVAPDGITYLADNGNNRLIRFDSTLNATHEIGGYGFSAGLLNNPTFVTLDNALNLLVIDESNRRIVRYDARLNFVDEIELRDEDDPFKYGHPSGVAVTDYGEVWVADRDQDRIALFDNAGRFSRFIGEFGYAGGQLRSPEKVTTIPDGDFVVADKGNSRLVFYDSYGSFSREITRAVVSDPVAMTFDGNHLWVLEASSGQVVCLDIGGRRPLVAIPMLVGDKKGLRNPRDIAALPDGRLVISDSGNNRLVICRILYDESD